MAASYVLSLVLVGLFSAAIANPQPDTTTTSTTTASPNIVNSAYYNFLEDSEMDTVCSVSMTGGSGSSSMTTTPASGNQTITNPSLCSTVGQGDPLCCAYAHAVHGFNATCVAPNVCAFSVNKTEPITTTPAPPGASTTTVDPTGTTTTMCPTTTVDPTGTTTTQPPPIPIFPSTVYISLAPLRPGLTLIKQCLNCSTAIVYPSSDSTTTSTTTQKS